MNGDSENFSLPAWAYTDPEFLALEREYMASDARAEAFAGVPQRVAEYNIRFVGDTFV